MFREPNIRSELLPSGVQCLGYDLDGAWLRGRGPRKTPLDPPTDGHVRRRSARCVDIWHMSSNNWRQRCGRGLSQFAAQQADGMRRRES